jgi:hypothetical protein
MNPGALTLENRNGNPEQGAQQSLQRHRIPRAMAEQSGIKQKHLIRKCQTVSSCRRLRASVLQGRVSESGEAVNRLSEAIFFRRTLLKPILLPLERESASLPCSIIDGNQAMVKQIKEVTQRLILLSPASQDQLDRQIHRCHESQQTRFRMTEK